MNNATPNPPDPVGIIKTLDADAISRRLSELDAEASALRVLPADDRARLAAMVSGQTTEADAPNQGNR
jgi:hypothetical protein